MTQNATREIAPERALIWIQGQFSKTCTKVGRTLAHHRTQCEFRYRRTFRTVLSIVAATLLLVLPRTTGWALVFTFFGLVAAVVLVPVWPTPWQRCRCERCWTYGKKRR